MDAHLFRRIAVILGASLQGAQVQRIHEPTPGVYAFSLYARHGSCCLMLRGQKNAPLLFTTEKNPLPNPSFPGAEVMRLRKYVEGHRLGSPVCDWLARRMAFPLPGPEACPGGWLVLDLMQGAFFAFELPQGMKEDVIWPDRQTLHDLLTVSDHTEAPLAPLSPWRAYPVLTPALRATVRELDLPEASALLVDLEAGDGDIYQYGAPGQAVHLSAWPLPASLQKKYGAELPLEQSPQAILEAVRAIGLKQLLTGVEARQASAEGQPARREAKKKDRLRSTLLHEQERLRPLLERREHAVLIQSNLWRLPAQEHRAELSLPPSDTTSPESALPVVIPLDKRHSVQENMRLFFHQAARAGRGLALLARRLEALDQGIDIFHPPQHPPRHKTPTGAATTKAQPWIDFMSSDGFMMLRGKSAAGNQAILKQAQPFDYWFHAENGPSAHLILRRRHAAQDVPPRTLLEAAALVALKSPCKDDRNVPVMCALAKHVHPAKGGPAGAVHVLRTLTTLRASPDPELEKRLLFLQC